MSNIEKRLQKLVMVVALMLAHGVMKGNLEYSSITVKKYWFLLLVGSGPLKLTFNRLNG